MSRPIKFRAWDKAYRAMCHSETGVEHVASWLENRDIFIVMQCTGLKDRNGVEIYEGDKVRHASTPYLTAPVHYRPNLAAWFAGSLRLDKAYTDRCEVIGNVYENGDLLK